MKKNLLPWIAGSSALLLILALTSVSRSPGAISEDIDQNTRINLALREIADQLLKQNNDFLSPIPPIRKEAEGTYLLLLNTKVGYFHLRSTVDKILKHHEVRPDYRLSLLDCESDEILLGFLAYETDEEDEFACQDREQTTACYNIRLAFINPEKKMTRNSWPFPVQPFQWLLIGLAFCVPLVWLAWHKKQKADPAGSKALKNWIQKTAITSFHPLNQILKINGRSTPLTFREAKLLKFFFDHMNQVLEREKILQAVWEDEGIIVGRSLDVFVSRLRKKLKADNDLNIVNVHGVGYKLEVKAER